MQQKHPKERQGRGQVGSEKPNLPGRIQQDSLCDRTDDQSENDSGITEVKMKLVIVRAEDKRQVKKEKQSST